MEYCNKIKRSNFENFDLKMQYVDTVSFSIVTLLNLALTVVYIENHYYVVVDVTKHLNVILFLYYSTTGFDKSDGFKICFTRSFSETVAFKEYPKGI